MQATNDHEVTGHNRTIRFSGIPGNQTKGDPETLDIVIRYQGDGNGAKGIAIDHHIIPAIMAGLAIVLKKS